MTLGDYRSRPLGKLAGQVDDEARPPEASTMAVEHHVVQSLTAPRIV